MFSSVNYSRGYRYLRRTWSDGRQGGILVLDYHL